MAFCGLFVILMMAGIVGFVANERTTRQTAADAAAAFGFGAPIANARVEDVSCSPRYRSSTSAAILFHRCDVRIAGPAGRLADMQIDLHRPVTIAEAGAVHRVGMQWAVVWPRPLALRRAAPVVPLLALVAGVGAFGVWAVLRALTNWQAIRAARHGQIVEVDLLRRRRKRGRFRWDFGFDHQGARRFGSSPVSADPIILDGVVTRGAALVAPSGKAWLLVAGFVPLDWPGSIRNALSRQIGDSFDLPRTALGDAFDVYVDSLPAGPGRDYAEAWRMSWNAPDVEGVNIGLERRHAGAGRLALADVDALLRSSRQRSPYVGPGWG